MGYIRENDQDDLRNNANGEHAIADVGPNSDNAPIYKSSFRMLVCKHNFQKKGKNIQA